MEVIGGIASVTQLAVYTHTAWGVLTRLRAELRGGPTSWQEYATNLEHLIQITKCISCLSEQEQRGATEQIKLLVGELSKIAERARGLISRARQKTWGVRWSAIGLTEGLAEIFRSLREKRDLLQLALANENLLHLASIRAGAPREKMCRGSPHDGAGTHPGISMASFDDHS